MLTVKNWQQFQHYKGRRPPWIKLHRTLLEDAAFQRLPLASRALAPMLWLMAAEAEPGRINLPSEDIAWRLRVTTEELESALKPLIEHGFFMNGKSCESNALASCKQNAMTETETETETEKTKHAARKAAPARQESVKVGPTSKKQEPQPQVPTSGKAVSAGLEPGKVAARDVAFKSFSERFGTRPAWTQADYSQLAALWRRKPDITLGDFAARWAAFLNSRDPFHVKQGGSLKYFCTNYDKFGSPAGFARPQASSNDEAKLRARDWREWCVWADARTLDELRKALADDQAGYPEWTKPKIEAYLKAREDKAQ